MNDQQPSCDFNFKGTELSLNFSSDLTLAINNDLVKKNQNILAVKFSHFYVTIYETFLLKEIISSKNGNNHQSPLIIFYLLTFLEETFTPPTNSILTTANEGRYSYENRGNAVIIILNMVTS